MGDTTQRILCISTYEKGQDFLRQCAEMGARPTLLTVEKHRDGDWPVALSNGCSRLQSLPMHTALATPTRVRSSNREEHSGTPNDISTIRGYSVALE